MTIRRKIKTIGIPRAVSYYQNFPFYYGFFDSLGLDVIVSDKTTAKTINTGSKYVVSETCLPVKVFTGHVMNLIDKGVYDIFIPSIQSIGYKVNNCSKIRGLPEIIRNVINKPVNIIEPVLDITENKGFYDFWHFSANEIGVFDERQISSAIKAGWEKYNQFIEMTKSGISFNIAIKNITKTNCHTQDYVNKRCFADVSDDLYEHALKTQALDITKPLSVVIMAHGYNLFDEKISLNLIKKLEKMDVKVYTALNVTKEDALKSIQSLGEILYWANECDLTGVAAYYMLNKKIDGIIALSAFGCGPDSLMVDEINYHAKNMNIPMLHLTIDEHTGEAGFITRLEAFTDMLLRKKRNNLQLKHKQNRFNKFSITEKKTLVIR